MNARFGIIFRHWFSDRWVFVVQIVVNWNMSLVGYVSKMLIYLNTTPMPRIAQPNGSHPTFKRKYVRHFRNNYYIIMYNLMILFFFYFWYFLFSPFAIIDCKPSQDQSKSTALGGVWNFVELSIARDNYTRLSALSSTSNHWESWPPCSLGNHDPWPLRARSSIDYAKPKPWLSLPCCTTTFSF